LKGGSHLNRKAKTGGDLPIKKKNCRGEGAWFQWRRAKTSSEIKPARVLLRGPGGTFTHRLESRVSWKKRGERQGSDGKRNEGGGAWDYRQGQFSAIRREGAEENLCEKEEEEDENKLPSPVLTMYQRST